MGAWTRYLHLMVRAPCCCHWYCISCVTDTELKGLDVMTYSTGWDGTGDIAKCPISPSLIRCTFLARLRFGHVCVCACVCVCVLHWPFLEKDSRGRQPAAGSRQTALSSVSVTEMAFPELYNSSAWSGKAARYWELCKIMYRHAKMARYISHLRRACDHCKF